MIVFLVFWLKEFLFINELIMGDLFEVLGGCIKEIVIIDMVVDFD